MGLSLRLVGGILCRVTDGEFVDKQTCTMDEGYVCMPVTEVGGRLGCEHGCRQPCHVTCSPICSREMKEKEYQWGSIRKREQVIKKTKVKKNYFW